MNIQVIKSRREVLNYLPDITSLLYENLSVNLPDEGWTAADASSQAETLLSNIEQKTAFLFIATENDRLVGFAWTYKRQYAKRQRLHINHIIVRSDRRGEGIGKNLLKAIIAKAQTMDVDAIDLNSSKSREDVVRFYLENGFCVERLQMIFRVAKAETGRNN